MRQPVMESAGQDTEQEPTIPGPSRIPISGFSTAKELLDRTSGVTDWRYHDLRRTARSLMSRAGVANDIAERVLGHAIPAVAGVYDRRSYVAEKRDALARLAHLVEEITRPRQFA